MTTTCISDAFITCFCSFFCLCFDLEIFYSFRRCVIASPTIYEYKHWKPKKYVNGGERVNLKKGTDKAKITNKTNLLLNYKLPERKVKNIRHNSTSLYPPPQSKTEKKVNIQNTWRLAPTSLTLSKLQ